MANLADIKYRIKSIAETCKITKAMETISVAKMRKAMTVYNNNLMYFTRIKTVIRDIVLHTKDVTHKYLKKRGGERAMYIVIASDKGLAGGYNHNVLVTALDMIKKTKERSVFTIGQVAKEFFDREKITVDAEFSHLTNNPTVKDAFRIVDTVINLYDKDMVDDVYVIFTEMVNSAIMNPEIIKLLPLELDEITEGLPEDKSKDEYYYNELFYDPSPEEVLKDLVPQYLGGIIYGALVQSVVSEHTSRMYAMSNATKNGEELLSNLNLEYNRARQEKITNELIEIVNAANHLIKGEGY